MTDRSNMRRPRAGPRGRVGARGGCATVTAYRALMRIELSSVISHRLEDVVAWHQRPGALVRMIPPALGSVEDPRQGGIEDGTRVRTRLGPAQLGRIRPEWTLEHCDVTQTPTSFSFVDSQVTGPFRAWRHHHHMEQTDDGASTRLQETIDLRLPRGAGIGERIAAGQVRRMLDFRAAQLEQDLDLHRRLAGAPRLTVAVAGASGLIGTQLTALLSTGGHRVLRMVRGRRAGEGEIAWDPAAGVLDPSDLEGVDAVVNLAGRSIATRMTARAKHEILASRTSSSGLIARTLAQLARSGSGPRILVQASGIGYYGARRPGELLTEDSAPGEDVLANVCRAWEEQMAPAAQAGVRTCAVRTGIVLTDAGGALAPQLPLFLAGVGGPLTSRDAAISWITLDDMARSYVHALLTDALDGPVNAVAPQPTTAGELARTLGRVLHRPSAVPVPPFGPRLVLGREGARAIVETDQRVSDERLRASGFQAAHPELEGALRHVLRR